MKKIPERHKKIKRILGVITKKRREMRDLRGLTSKITGTFSGMRAKLPEKSRKLKVNREIIEKRQKKSYKNVDKRKKVG